MAIAIPALLVARAAVEAPPVTVHSDGEGPLASTGDPTGGWTMAVAVTEQNQPVTFAVPLCIESAGGIAVIRRVSPTSTTGQAPELLGASLRTFRPTDQNLPMVSSPGFPPAVPDPLVDAIGSSISARCSGTESTELLVGLRPVPGVGGGWMGEVVDYESGGRSYSLVLHYGLLFCGPAISPSYCEAPAP